MTDAGPRLGAFRRRLGLSLRAAAVQLHVKHPTLKDWEEGGQIPAPPYRDAIEVWTDGAIKAAEWPIRPRELEIAENAGKVQAAVPHPSADDTGPHPRASESGELPAVDVSATGTD
jgi:transcriptional regulator with XRE-family HTH domain